MIKDKIIAVLNCATYLNQMQISIPVIKQMIYSQLKDYLFVDIEKIANDENIDILFLTSNDEDDEKKQTIQKRKKGDIKRIREGKPR